MKPDNFDPSFQKKIMDGGEGTYEAAAPDEPKRYHQEDEMTNVEIDDILARIKRRKNDTETR